MKSSSRVHSMWIGVPRCAFAIMIACSACGPLPLRPNPPPRWHRCRWTFVSGIAGDLRGAEARLLRALIADPDVHAIVGDEHRRVAGLHAGARQDTASSRSPRRSSRRRANAGVDVALIDAHRARLIERRQRAPSRMFARVERGVLRRHRPLDRHPIERRLGLIPGVGDDGDAAAEDAAAGQRRIRNRELHGGAHARHAADRLEVVALDVAAVDRARLHRRPLHARQADVDPVDRLARDLVRARRGSSARCPSASTGPAT